MLLGTEVNELNVKRKQFKQIKVNTSIYARVPFSPIRGPGSPCPPANDPTSLSDTFLSLKLLPCAGMPEKQKKNAYALKRY